MKLSFRWSSIALTLALAVVLLTVVAHFYLNRTALSTARSVTSEKTYQEFIRVLCQGGPNCGRILIFRAKDKPKDMVVVHLISGKMLTEPIYQFAYSNEPLRAVPKEEKEDGSLVALSVKDNKYGERQLFGSLGWRFWDWGAVSGSYHPGTPQPFGTEGNFLSFVWAVLDVRDPTPATIVVVLLLLWGILYRLEKTGRISRPKSI